MTVKLGKITKLDPKIVWPNEARHFTPWLAENISYLGEILGMDLEITEIESPVGNYTADILAKDLNNNSIVVIENQYSTTDHDHLGKLLTYASGVGAQTIVWITQSLREEHRQALEWLNERTDTDTRFFAIELELLQIDDSAPAHNFKVIVSPNNWHKRTTSRVSTALGEAYRIFFQRLVDELREKHHFTNSRVADTGNWHSFASGYSGIQYSASFTWGKRARTEVYIDLGDQTANKELFNWLYSRRQEIETATGELLVWEKLDERRASRIALYRQGDITSSEEELSAIHEWMVDHLLQLKRVFGPLLAEYFRTLGRSALQIDDSAPAHNFKVIVSPNNWHKRTTSRVSTSRGEAYRIFFQRLVDELREKHHFTNARVTGTGNGHSFVSGYSGIRYSASFALGKRARTEVYIDLGDQTANKELFNWLYSRRQEIETATGELLVWEKLDERRASRIALYRQGDITSSEEELSAIHEWMVDHLLQLKRVFDPLLAEYFRTLGRSAPSQSTPS